ncbi:hypothetical protein Btru_045150 [Bulinus truncatus]|nr:hypothetical protein Btru_045150 [Bulinus truncatus]
MTQQLSNCGYDRRGAGHSLRSQHSANRWFGCWTSTVCILVDIFILIFVVADEGNTSGTKQIHQPKNHRNIKNIPLILGGCLASKGRPAHVATNASYVPVVGTASHRCVVVCFLRRGGSRADACFPRETTGVAAYNTIIPLVAAYNTIIPLVAVYNMIIPLVAAYNTIIPLVAVYNMIIPLVAAYNTIISLVAVYNTIIPLVAV